MGALSDLCPARFSAVLATRFMDEANETETHEATEEPDDMYPPCRADAFDGLVESGRAADFNNMVHTQAAGLAIEGQVT